MKRTFVLLTLVAALVAAPAFADATFTGSFKYEAATDFDTYANALDDGSTISLDGTIGEFSSISVGIEEDDDNVMTLNTVSLTQDVTGALGMDTPVSFSYKLGKLTYEPADKGTVNGYNQFENSAEVGTDDSLGFVATFGMGDVLSIDAAVFPKSYIDEKAEFGVTAYGLVAMFDYVAYYTMSEANGDFFGANFALDFSPLKIGAIVEYADATETTGYGVSAGYDVTDAINVGAAFGSAIKDGGDFAADSCFGVNATYKAMDNLSFFAAVKATDLSEIADNIGYEVGLETALDGVTYCVGWSDASSWKAYEHNIVDGAVFTKISASF